MTGSIRTLINLVEAAQAGTLGEAAGSDWLVPIIKRFDSLPIKDRVFLFGSVARGSEAPNDLDVMIDFRGISVASADPTIMALLFDIKREYRGSLDLFIVFSDGIASCGGGYWTYGDATRAAEFYADVEDDLMSLRDWFFLNEDGE